MSVEQVHIFNHLFLLYIGLMGMNVSMPRHAKMLFKAPLTLLQVRASYYFGWGCLVLAFYVATLVWGVGVGITVGLGSLTLLLGLIIFIQSYNPRLSLHLALLCAVLLCVLQVLG